MRGIRWLRLKRLFDHLKDGLRLDAGLSPADMLRIMLPSTDGEDHWPLVQAALLDGPEDADYSEVRGVLEFFFLAEEEILGALDVEGAQRDQVALRLGLRD